MPRSGTTLVEQILVSHPDVAGAGEVLDLKRTLLETVPALRRDNFPEGVCGLDRDAFKRLGEAYVARLRAHGGPEMPFRVGVHYGQAASKFYFRRDAAGNVTVRPDNSLQA